MAMTQSERRARTRDRLLKSASQVFARHGYHAARVEEIAARADCSTGALYAHFDSKEELFLALVEEHVERQIEHYVGAVQRGGGIAERARAGADEWMSYLRREPDYFPIFISFWSYAVTQAELRPQLAARFEALRQTGSRLIEEGAAELGVPLVEGMPEQIATIITALGNGLALHKLAQPEAGPDEMFGDSIALFLEALAALAREYSASQSEVTYPRPTTEGDH